VLDIAEFTASDSLKIPSHLAARFKPSDKFVVWAEGDTLHFKRITQPAITDIVAQAPAEEALSLEEINAIVHHVRQAPQEK
jgi:hypothetical protein